MNQPQDRRSTHRWPLWWAIATVWWTLDGFTSATNYHRIGQSVGNGLTWDHALRMAMSSAWLWVPLTVFAIWLAERFTLDRDSWLRHLPVHLAAAAGVCLVRMVAVVVLNPWIGWYAEIPPLGELVLTSIANNLFLFGLLVGIGHALVFARRYRERDEQLVRSELNVLKMQLHPHFLFNALNTVTSFVRSDPERAERTIARLSRLLRYALDASGTHEVPLEEELRVARTFLEIEQARFEDRLRVRWQIQPETYMARVPHLILQPLVENAIRHGIMPRAAAGTLEVAAERIDGALRLSVADDGVGFAADDRPAQGVGLRNTRARLRQLYGERQRFEISACEQGGTRVTITIPFRAAPAHEPEWGERGLSLAEERPATGVLTEHV